MTAKPSARFTSAFTLVAALTVAAPVAFQTPFRARTEIVAVDVLVKVKNVPVTSLTARDFELRDNGVVQQIDAVRADSVPVDLTLLVDASGSARNLLGEFSGDIRRVARLLRPDDRVRLLTFAGTTVQAFGFQPGHENLPLDRIESGSGATALDDALLLALAWVPEPRRRHLVAAFTDGGENASVVQRRQLIAAAVRAPALLYIVLRSSTGVVYPTIPAGTTSLYTLAAGTGGGLIRPEKSTAILDGFKLVFETFRSGYVLQYTPRGVSRDGWHDLVVTVTTPGKYEVTARKGYAGS
jgi:VWFA-related protein